MNIRTIERQIAKNRIKALGAGNVNKKMNAERGGVKLWRRVISGDLAKQGAAAQQGQGVKSRRKVKKVSA